MENPPTELVQMFEKLHAAKKAAVDGELKSSHHHEVDCAIVEALEQLSPVFLESTEETKQGELPAEEPVDPDAAMKLQALLAEHEGPLRNLVTDQKALGVLQDLFPSLQGRELEEMLATMENNREDVSELGNREVPTFPAAPTAPAGVGTGSLKPLVVCGPSGAGKGTLINMLREDFPGRFGFSVSHTTRKPRPGEVHGTHYYFSEKQEMQAEIDDNKFIEHADVFANLYGTSTAAVQSVAAAGKICILDIDVQSVKSVRNAGRSVLDPHYLFISAPSMEVLEARLRGRGTETEVALQRRLANAKAEMDYGWAADNFERVLVNDGLREAYAELKETAKAWYPQLAEDEEKNAGTPTEP